MGTIFHRKIIRADGTEYEEKNLTIRYYNQAKGYTVTESTGSPLMHKAQQRLRQLETAKDNDEPIIPRNNRVTMKDLFQMVVIDYKNEDFKTLDKVEERLKLHLEPFFGYRKARTVSFADIEAYKAFRKGQKASAGTINRELAIVRRAFTLGVQAAKIVSAPKFEKLDESANVRSGFFEPDEFLRLLPYLPAYLRPLVELAYSAGWRKAELINLKWTQINRVESIMTLQAAQSKNKKARRLLYADNEEIQRLIELQFQKKILLEQSHQKCEYLFFHDNGRQIKSFRGSWDAACEAANLTGKIFHDLRRSAIRNMIRAGISEKIAMQISGHRTRSVFDRYDITDDRDLQNAAAKLGLHSNFERKNERKDEKSNVQLRENSVTYSDESTTKLPQ